MCNKLDQLLQRAIAQGANGHMLNRLHEAEEYTGILEVVVKAGSLSALAVELGVSFQAVQQWVKRGFVPSSRLAEIESTYGVPRTALMNPKYAEILAAPSFTAV